MKRPARRVRREDQRLLVRVQSWNCPYSFTPHYDRKSSERFFEVFHVEGTGVVERPTNLIRALRSEVEFRLAEDARLPSQSLIEPKGVGVYWISGDQVSISAWVPPGRLAALGPWLVADRLPWLHVELSYPERRNGRLLSFRLEALPDFEDWEGGT